MGGTFQFNAPGVLGINNLEDEKYGVDVLNNRNSVNWYQI